MVPRVIGIVPPWFWASSASATPSAATHRGPGRFHFGRGSFGCAFGRIFGAVDCGFVYFQSTRTVDLKAYFKCWCFQKKTAKWLSSGKNLVNDLVIKYALKVLGKKLWATVKKRSTRVTEIGRRNSFSQGCIPEKTNGWRINIINSLKDYWNNWKHSKTISSGRTTTFCEIISVKPFTVKVKIWSLPW